MNIKVELLEEFITIDNQNFNRNVKLYSSEILQNSRVNLHFRI